MTTFRLGKKPAREGAVRFSLAHYMSVIALPEAPPVFGHTDLLAESKLGMLGNDKFGDCVWAGADHEHMGWGITVGNEVRFTEASALADYAAETGFDPLQTDANGNNPTDQGTDMEEAAKYRRTTGVIDADGNRHKIGAYVALPGVSTRGDNSPTFLATLASAAYVFGTVGIGIEFPASAMQQFEAGDPWEVVDGSPIEGGHYVPLVGRNEAGNFIVITWGAYQEVTPAFLAKYVDEAVVYLSTDFLNGAGRSLEGFDLSALNADIIALGGQPAPVPTPSPAPAPTAFPLAKVQPWLNGHQYTKKSRAASTAIRDWLAQNGL